MTEPVSADEIREEIRASRRRLRRLGGKGQIVMAEDSWNRLARLTGHDRSSSGIAQARLRHRQLRINSDPADLVGLPVLLKRSAPEGR